MIGLPIGFPYKLKLGIVHEFAIRQGPPYVIGLHLSPALQEAVEARLISYLSPLWSQVLVPCTKIVTVTFIT
jgi:hypothetical protein